MHLIKPASTGIASILLSVVLWNTAWADIEKDIWYFTDSLTGGQYPSLSEAETAMKATSASAAHLDLTGKTFNELGEEYYYEANPPFMQANLGPWEYWQMDYAGGRASPNEQGAVDQWLDLSGINANPCGPGNTAPDSDWIAFVGDWRGDPHPIGPITPEGIRRYKNTRNIGANCNIQTETGFLIRSLRTVGCNSGYILDTVAEGCKNDLTATIRRNNLTTASASNLCGVGNPCDPATGNKFQRETDYSGVGPDFYRTFHSQYFDPPWNYFVLGPGWTHNYEAHLVVDATASFVTGLYRPNGRFVPVEAEGGSSPWLIATNDSGLRLKQEGIKWVVYLPDGSREIYGGSQGALTKLIDPAGLETTIEFRSGTPLIGSVSKVIGPFGHTLTFNWEQVTNTFRWRIASITDPAGNAITFTQTRGLLTSVTYQDGATRTYHYEDPFFPLFLTGITDEEHQRYATFGYDSLGRATLTEHAGGHERFTLDYNTDGSTTVTDAANNQTVYAFNQNGVGLRQPQSVTLASASRSFTYESGIQKRIASRTDEDGNTTQYAYDANHRISQTEAAGTPEERETTFAYLDDKHSLPTRVTTPSVSAGQLREVLVAYDVDERPTAFTIRGYQPNGAQVERMTTIAYNADGQISQIDGPRSDVSDITTLTYYACSTGDECGQVQSVTNARSQVTDFTSYDAHGRVLSMTDPNGLIATFTYGLRGRILTMTQSPASGAARVTTFTYDNAGQLTSVTQPNGSVLTYAYDAAHQLVSVSDSLNNRIEYGYDLKGNRTSEKAYDPNNVLVRTLDTTYDIRNYVASINTAGSITQTVFDALGNLTSSTDANNQTTQHSYDPLDRIKQTTDALTGITGYSYDINDNLTQVDAPNGASTTYVYDDLGNLLEVRSPDTGLTTYTYDETGNRASKTDARGITVLFEYDALDRVTRSAYPNGLLDVTYSYDQGTNGNGRLTGITHATGTTTYSYDVFGNILTDTRTIDGMTYETRYTYDGADNIESITYPSGRVVSYQRDAIARVTAVTSSFNGISKTLVSGIDYLPFGPAINFTFGNGITLSKTYDQQYRLTTQTAGSALSYMYGLDAVGNIASITDHLDTSLGQTLGYDALDRLISADGGYGTLDYTYDGVGNRKTETRNGASDIYGYGASSNRLDSISGLTAAAFTYDPAGNTTDKDSLNFAYDDRNRLVAASTGGIVLGSYFYNGRGERVKKTAGTTTIFHYDQSGQLIAESDDQGNTLREYVYLNNQLIALFLDTGPSQSPLNLDSHPILSYGGGQDATGSATVEDGGATVRLVGNNWKKIDFPYTVTANTILEFDFRSSAQGDVHGIGLDTDNTVDSGSTFTVYGTQGWGRTNYDNYDGSGNSQHYRIPIGQYYTGVRSNLFFANDHDVASPNSETVFSNIRVYEGTPGSEEAFYYHTDHLGTPQVVTDDGQTVRWKAEYEPFGAVHLAVDGITNNLRFPGQYYDQETGLHYNYFRDYDPTIGRYVQSDPIGLVGGLGLYGYAHSNPVTWTDRLGLAPFPIDGDVIDVRQWLFGEIESDVNAGVEAVKSLPTSEEVKLTLELASLIPAIRTVRTCGAAIKAIPKRKLCEYALVICSFFIKDPAGRNATNTMRKIREQLDEIAEVSRRADVPEVVFPTPLP